MLYFNKMLIFNYLMMCKSRGTLGFYVFKLGYLLYRRIQLKS